MFSDLLFRLRSLFRRSAVEAELDDELRFHFEQQITKYMESGLTREEATRRARLETGGLDQIKEECREARGLHVLETIVQDVRYGLRMLRRSPMFTIVAVLTLSLGIGVNTAIFSMVDWLMLRPLPVPNAKQLVYLGMRHKSGYASNGFSYPNFEDIRQQTGLIFSSVAGAQMVQVDGLEVDGTTAPFWTNYVTGDFFSMMGVRPALGRFIVPSEDRKADADPVLVISYACWQSRFHGAADVIGKTVKVDGNPVKVIGVAPKGFHGAIAMLHTEGYLPMGMVIRNLGFKSDFFTNREDSEGTALFARLRTGVTLEQAQPVLDVIAKRLAQQYPKADDWTTVRVFHLGALPPSSDGPGEVPMIAALFLLLAGLVLLLACMNIANLLLVRAGVRSREIAVRSALGASRGRLVRQSLTESFLLAVLGCMGGILLGYGGSRALSAIPLGSSIPIILDLSFNWRVFAFAVVAAWLASLLVGMVPALRGSRVNANEILHESSRTFSGNRQRLRSVLAIAELGGSLALLIVAGLFVRSLQMVQHVDLGFDPQGVFNIGIDVHEAGYDATRARRFFEDALSRVRRLPGVQSAIFASTVPMGLENDGAFLKIPGYQPPKDQDRPSAGYDAVTPGYFATMRIPLLRGRNFLPSDDASSPYVAVVNETMAKKYWPGQDPIGRSFVLDGEPAHTVQIIGVAKDSRTGNISESIDAFLYLPLAQKYEVPVTLQVRTRPGQLAALMSSVSGIIRSMEPGMPLSDVKTMTAVIDGPNGLLLYQMGAGVSGAIGLLGLLLAIIGVYGVISYSAAQRTQEIGVRMALGAARSDILRMIFRQGTVLVGFGIALGVLVAAGFSSMLGNLLVGVKPLDAITYVGASGLLALIALIACYLPAHRAVRVDPMVALRHE
ncbi:MAG TPA: ABC transporter permease [Terriglobales bacterium]|nr:ABC transporter permease [Terriglobales bacterium]